MNGTQVISEALASRGLLQVDGDCACHKCKRDGLDRDQVHSVKSTSAIAVQAFMHGTTFCQDCIDIMWFDLEALAAKEMFAKHGGQDADPTCRVCRGKGSVWDEVSHDFHSRTACRDCKRLEAAQTEAQA